MRAAGTLFVVAATLALAGCGGTDLPAATSSGAASGSATLLSGTVTGHGTVVVAGSNHMTVYQFASDTSGSGTSACTEACITTWPPVTVTAGTTPTAATGLTATIGTISRTDGKGTQVTYNGRPVYFFSGDAKPGDSNGNYPGWSVVPVGGGAGAATTSTGNGYQYP